MRLQFTSAERALVWRYQLHLAQHRGAHAPCAPGTVSKNDVKA
jgi:hypothetical protein